MNQLRIFPLNEIAANFVAKLHLRLKAEGQEIDVFN